MMYYDIVVESYCIDEALEGFNPSVLKDKILSVLKALLRKFTNFIQRVRSMLIRKLPFLKKKLREEESERSHQEEVLRNNTESSNDETYMETQRYLECFTNCQERYLNGILELLQQTSFFTTELRHCVSAIQRHLPHIDDTVNMYGYNDIVSTIELCRSSYTVATDKHSELAAIVETYRTKYPEGESLATVEVCDMLQSTINDLGKQMQNSIAATIRQLESRSKDLAPEGIQRITNLTAALQEFTRDSIRLSSVLIELL